MSFWSLSPGPHWSHFWKSLFLCSPNDTGVLNPYISDAPRLLRPLPGTRIQELTELNAQDIETLLHSHYQTFPRSKLFLNNQRIREGFLYDGWIGIGIYTGLKLIGCCVSRDLGTLQILADTVPKAGLVDFFCVETSWRKKGISSLLLQELVLLTAKRKRLVHIFQKEGFPISPLPPIWQSNYIWRKKSLTSNQMKEYISKEEIATRTHIRTFSYTSALPYRNKNCIVNIPHHLSGDSELYSFNYKGYTVQLCISDTFHRSVPEGWKIGEVSWVLPTDIPIDIQEMAVEALVDNCRYDVILLDASTPHQKDKEWQKDSPYGYYLFNYNPAHFFSLKPFFVF